VCSCVCVGESVYSFVDYIYPQSFFCHVGTWLRRRDRARRARKRTRRPLKETQQIELTMYALVRKKRERVYYVFN